jgi:hypothetical protein
MEPQSKVIDTEKTNVSTFRAKPAIYKGGKGPFTLLARPCVFQFGDGTSPKLKARYNPPGSGWIALGLTVVTQIAVVAIAQVTGGMIGPGFIIWYLIIRACRRKDISIDLAGCEKIITDEKKRSFSIFGPCGNKKQWFSVKCSEGYDSIVSFLTQEDIEVEKGQLKRSDRFLIFALILFIILIVIIIMSFALSQ